MIQLTRSGTVLSDVGGELKKLSDQFQREHWVRLPQLIAPALLERLCDRLELAQFQPLVHEGVGVELCLQDSQIVGSLRFLTNDQEFFEIVKTITGCGRIGSFDGRVSRMKEGSGCHDSWHNDLVGDRMVALSINLSPQPHGGGVLLLRQNGARQNIAEIANTGFGDGIIFRLAIELEHRVTDVEGSVPRTVFAGWFQTQSGFLSERRQPN